MKKLSAALLAVLLMSIPALAGEPANPTDIAPDKLQYPLLHFQVPKPDQITLSNGITLYLYEDHELPLVQVTALIRTSSLYDPQGKEGLGDLTGKLLRDGGTKTMKSSDLDETLERSAIDLESSIGTESGIVSLSALRKEIDKGLDIFARIIREPAFEEDKVALDIALRSEDLRRIADNPQRFAFREFNRIIYADHPRSSMATPASLANIRRNDIIRFHRQFFHPGNISIAVSGDITKGEAVAKLNRVFGGWKGEGPALAPLPPVPRQKGGVYFIAKNTPQSIVLLGQRGPAKTSDDAYSFSVFDFITGSGGFTSRIFQEVRTNQGLAYSAGSFYSPRRKDGLFGAYAFTKSASTLKALSLMRTIIRNGMQRPVTSQELAWAQKSIDNGFIFTFTSAHQIAFQQMKIAFDGLPENYLASYRGKIDRVTLEDLSRVKTEYVRPEEEIILVVGDDEAFKQLKSEFKDIKVRKGLL